VPEGACFFAKDKGPEGCVSPAPELAQANVDTWRLFQLSFSCVNRAGMDGIPVGHCMTDVRAIAEGMRIPWDEPTVSRFLVLQAFWLDAVNRKRAEKK